MTKFQELYDFIDRAKKNRKYPEATAQSLRAALKLYDTELSDDERASLDKVKENFEQITRSVFSKNASKFTASSLATYKSRVQKVFAEYEKYGDPAKMNNWSPKVILRAKKIERRPTATGGAESSGQENTQDDLTSPDQPNVFSDKGTGWNLVIRSKRPMDSKIKKTLVDVAELLTELNKETDTVKE